MNTHPTPVIDTERQGIPSASGMERLYCCPGSWLAEKDAPAEAPNQATLEGQEIHEALETGDVEALDENGRNIAERLKALEEAEVAAWRASLGPVEKQTVWLDRREERLWIRQKKTFSMIASAKPDSFMVVKLHNGDHHGFTWDAKTGYLPVTPMRRNIQGRIQAISLDDDSDYTLASCRACISSFRFRGKSDVVDYTRKDLDMAYQELEFNLWKANQPHAPRYAGAWCRYCRAKNDCRVVGGYTLMPATYVSHLEKPSKDDIRALVSTLRPDQLVAIVERRSIIENVCDAAMTRLKALPADVLAGVGKKLSDEGEKRSIGDIQECFNILWNNGLIKTELEYRSLCKVALGGVEELCVSRLAEKDGSTKKDAKKKLGDLLKPCIETKPTSPRLLNV